jgi:hypothetical protein
MAQQHLDYDAAYAAVAAARPWICPNAGFKEQLQHFHATNYDLSKGQGWKASVGKKAQPECEICEDDLR